MCCELILITFTETKREITGVKKDHAQRKLNDAVFCFYIGAKS